MKAFLSEPNGRKKQQIIWEKSQHFSVQMEYEGLQVNESYPMGVPSGSQTRHPTHEYEGFLGTLDFSAHSSSSVFMPLFRELGFKSTPSNFRFTPNQPATKCIHQIFSLKCEVNRLCVQSREWVFRLGHPASCQRTPTHQRLKLLDSVDLCNGAERQLEAPHAENPFQCFNWM